MWDFKWKMECCGVFFSVVFDALGVFCLLGSSASCVCVCDLLWEVLCWLLVSVLLLLLTPGWKKGKG